MLKNQKGFALLEGLLIFIIIAIIGGTGLYVMKAKNQTNKTLDNAATNNTSVATEKSTKTTQIATKKILDIKEWGVKASYSSKVDLIYKVTSDNLGENWAQISSAQMKQADPNCDEQSQMGGIIIRLHSGDHLRGPAGDDTGQSVEAAISSSIITEYSHVGDYYYYFSRPQAACGSDGSKADLLQSPTLDAARVAAKNFVSAN